MYGCQPRYGKIRRPDIIERRAGIVGMASGNARVKRSALAGLVPGRRLRAAAVDVVGAQAVHHHDDDVHRVRRGAAELDLVAGRLVVRVAAGRAEQREPGGTRAAGPDHIPACEVVSQGWLERRLEMSIERIECSSGSLSSTSRTIVVDVALVVAEVVEHDLSAVQVILSWASVRSQPVGDLVRADQVRSSSAMSARRVALSERGQTWVLTGSLENFRATREHGFRVIGAKEGRRGMAEQIEPGDRIVFYVTGVKAFGGIVRVTGEMYEDREKIWPGKPGNPDPTRGASRPSPSWCSTRTSSCPPWSWPASSSTCAKWPAEHWTLAFQGQLRAVTDADAELLERRMREAAPAAA